MSSTVRMQPVTRGNCAYSADLMVWGKIQNAQANSNSSQVSLGPAPTPPQPSGSLPIRGSTQPSVL